MIHKRIQKAKEIDPGTAWRSRGYLPHFDAERVTQFITFRLANSLPRNFLRTLKFRLDSRQITDIEYHREIEKFLDSGYGPQYLRLESIGNMVVENLLKFDGHKYSLLHWVIMPNHIQVLLRLMPRFSLASIMHSIKSYTANRANRMLGLTDRFSSVEYFDRYIRNADHFSKTVAYIHANPVKGRLCDKAEDWVFGCAGRHE